MNCAAAGGGGVADKETVGDFGHRAVVVDIERAADARLVVIEFALVNPEAGVVITVDGAAMGGAIVRETHLVKRERAGVVNRAAVLLITQIVMRRIRVHQRELGHRHRGGVANDEQPRGIVAADAHLVAEAPAVEGQRLCNRDHFGQGDGLPGQGGRKGNDAVRASAVYCAAQAAEAAVGRVLHGDGRGAGDGKVRRGRPGL